MSRGSDARYYAARDARGAWRPFALACRVATPVSLNHPWLHLDGIVGHLIHQRTLGRDYQVLPTKAVTHLGIAAMGDYAYALARTGELIHASVSVFEPDKIGTLHYFKRFEERDYPKAHKVNMASGHYRAWMLRTVYQSCETVTFHGKGNLAILRDLLSDLTHLGNDTRIGWGRILDWTLTPTPADWSLVRDGIAQRPIPTRLCATYDDAVPLAWRPPYWAAGHMEACVPPGAGVTLG